VESGTVGGVTGDGKAAEVLYDDNIGTLYFDGVNPMVSALS
jgi:hypothetical protein